MHLPQLLPSAPGCELCDLHLNAHNPGIASVHHSESLPPDPENQCIIMVNQNPGFHSDQTATPFSPKSKAGFFVRDSLCARPLDERGNLNSLASIYFSHICRCQGEKPKTSQYKTCAKTYLWPELDLLRAHFKKPPLIFALGRPAAAYTYEYLSQQRTSQKTESLVTKNGELLNGFYFVSTYHPAAMFREHSYFEAILNHTRIVYDLITGHQAPITEPTIVAPFPPLGKPPCPN